MTREEAVALLERYSNYDGMGIPNLAGCKEAMRVAVDALKEAYPELAESEDERIRKEIKDIVLSYRSNCVYEGNHHFNECLSWLEKQKDASKAIEAVDRIDKYIDENVANAHDMKDSNPDKQYYRGWDEALGEMAGILQDVYSEKENKFAPRALPRSAAWFEDGDEKQKEQKHILKFKVGDKVHLEGDDVNILTITGIEEDRYLTDNSYGPILFGAEDIWEIVEQKPAEWDEYTKTNLDRALQIIKKAKGTLQGYQSDDGIYECDKAIECLEHFLYRGLEIEKPAEWSEPDNIDEVAREIVIKMHPCLKDCTILGDRLTRGQLMALVKAGAEWMANRRR